VRRGRELTFDHGPWRSSANVASRMLSPGISEQVTAHTGAVEWDVVLDAAPAGRGDLVLDAEVTGTTGPPAQLDSTLSWPVGDRRVTMGEVVVRDVHGVELNRALPRAHGTHVSLRVPDSVLTHGAYPLTVDPRVSPEHRANSLTGDYAPGQIQGPAIAFDGTHYLVVWRQDTLAPYIGLRATLVDTNGDYVGEGVGALITSTPAGTPQVTFDGTNFVVAWSDGRNDSSTSSDIYGARVSTGGQVLDPNGIAISTAPGYQADPHLASNGVHTLVVWEDQRNSGNALYGARVASTGTVLDPTLPVTGGGLRISTTTGYQNVPSVASDGTNWLVAWENLATNFETRRILSTVVSAAGVAATPAGTAVSTATSYHPAVAWNGSEYLTVWTDYRSGQAVYGTRQNRTGVVQDPSGIPIFKGSGTSPAVAAEGSTFLVAWTKDSPGSDIYGTRVEGNGTVPDTGFAIAAALTHFEYEAAVVGASGRWGVAYTRDISEVDPFSGIHNEFLRIVSRK
jgi:hypothetical protein